MTHRPQTHAALVLAGHIRDFDLTAMRAEIAALRQRMRELGWPEPIVSADEDAALCYALTECQQIIRRLCGIDSARAAIPPQNRGHE